MVTSNAEAVRNEALLVVPLTVRLTVASLTTAHGLGLAAGLGMFLLTTIAWRRRRPASTSCGVLFVAWLGLGLAGVGPQQLTFALALAGYGVLVSRVSWLRDAGQWLAVGRLDARTLTFSAAFAALSGAVLLVWHVLAQPSLDDLVATFVPDWPFWLLAAAAVGFSIVNAVLEEAAYRGVLQHALERAVGAGHAALVLQATAFAALHFLAGFPRGMVGVAVTFAYGLVLGTIRRQAGGLAAPVAVHALTDLAIVAIVLTLAEV
ncbi:MAG: type II CAAX endopeptidase family protein [Acidobacteria bacterium]|nr:type II CAAX endopeptidase family protein [Acidobacteriota bacterium]